MAFFSYLCNDCFGNRSKASASKPTESNYNSVAANFSPQRLIGTTVCKGTRPAAKSPFHSIIASTSIGKGNDGTNGRGNFLGDLRRSATYAGNTAVSDRLMSQESSVKVTKQFTRHEDTDGNKMINEYARVRKIGMGSYGKVVLHRRKTDDQLYAIKMFHKSRLRKLRVGPAETAMMDVEREVAIMKRLDHPNIVKLMEVIDDPESDYFYMVLEYVERTFESEDSEEPPGAIGIDVARRYVRDVVAGLAYLHKNNIVHGDIKPQNLLMGRDGRIKLCDFGVSQLLKDGNEELRRTPGTPVCTAPECCLGVTYKGKLADIWALGCTLYYMVLGRFPFVGSSLEGTYEKIVNDEFWFPTDLDPDLVDLLLRILCKDPKKRIQLDDIVHHRWVTKAD